MSAIQVEVAKNGIEPVLTTPLRVVAVAFVHSVPFANESSSVQVGRNCDTVWPARLKGDGTPARIEENQKADGLLIRRSVHNMNTNLKYTEQVFVAFANIRGIQYGK